MGAKTFIGVTKNGIRENCAWQGVGPCPRHAMHIVGSAKASKNNSVVESLKHEDVAGENDTISFDGYNRYMEDYESYAEKKAAVQAEKYNNNIANMDVGSLVMLGFDEERAVAAWSRPVGDGSEPPMPKHISLRIDSLVAEKAFNDKYNEIVGHKFSFGTSRKEKQKFYTEKMDELSRLKKNVEDAGRLVMFAEQTKDWDRDSRRSRMYLDYHDIPAGPDEMWYLPERSAQREVVNRFDVLEIKLQEDKVLAKPLPYGQYSKERLRSMRKNLRQQWRRNW